MGGGGGGGGGLKGLTAQYNNPVQVVGNYCMQLAISKAKDVGIGWVTCTGEHTL